MDLLAFLARGLTQAGWITHLLWFLCVTQLTIFSVTIYLHRVAAHRAADLHPAVAHVFRFWTWLTTAMVTKQWIAIHRKHHAHCETAEDPHSPQTHGIRKVLFDGVDLYRRACHDTPSIEKYGGGAPNDWLERKIYTPRPWLGPTVMFVLNFALFGAVGIVIWALQMSWIPFFAAGVINGLGHFVGYRNFDTRDAATNLVPWGVLIGGEELHNNHHAHPSSAKFSQRRFEFDIGWAVLRSLTWLRLARVKRVAPKLRMVERKELDVESLRALVAHRFQVMSDYFRHVVLPTVQDEARQAGASIQSWRTRAKQLLKQDAAWLSERRRGLLASWQQESPRIGQLMEYRAKLRAIWETRHATNDELLHAVRNWCDSVEQSGIESLREFSLRLRNYAVA